MEQFLTRRCYKAEFSATTGSCYLGKKELKKCLNDSSYYLNLTLKMEECPSTCWYIAQKGCCCFSLTSLGFRSSQNNVACKTACRLLILTVFRVKYSNSPSPTVNLFSNNYFIPHFLPPPQKKNKIVVQVQVTNFKCRANWWSPPLVTCVLSRSFGHQEFQHLVDSWMCLFFLSTTVVEPKAHVYGFMYIYI